MLRQYAAALKYITEIIERGIKEHPGVCVCVYVHACVCMYVCVCVYVCVHVIIQLAAVYFIFL